MQKALSNTSKEGNRRPFLCGNYILLARLECYSYIKNPRGFDIELWLAVLSATLLFVRF